MELRTPLFAKHFTNYKRNCITYAFTISFLLLSGLALSGCAGSREAKQLADISHLKDVSVPSINNTSKIFSADGVKLADLYMEKRVYVKLDEIPEHLQEAFISIEDERFFSHKGVDSRGMLRSLFRVITAGRFSQGASTITMQLARNLYLTKEKTLSRKSKEILIAIELENKYTKQEILEAYLNEIYFGHGAYGVKAAADMFFGKDLKKLTIADCAIIAAVVKGPGVYSPFISPEASLKRKKLIIDKMLSLKFISQEEHDEALNEKLHLKKLKNKAYQNYKAPHFVSYIIDQLTNEDGDFRMTAQQLHTGGYSIFTTIDSNLQRYAERSVESGVIAANLYLARPKGTDAKILYYAMNNDVGILSINSDDEYNDYIDDSISEYCKNCNNPESAGDALCSKLLRNVQTLTSLKRKSGCWLRGPLKKIKLDSILHARATAKAVSKVHQGALSAIDSKNGNVLAMVGGVDFSVSRLNHVWPFQRQAGSSFKPFVYLTALENGQSMRDTVQNAKYCIDKYCPKNYGNNYGNGATVTYKDALVFSLNIPAVIVGHTAGEDKIVKLCQDLGITAQMTPTPSLALGAAEISPLEMSEAYAAISNGGHRIDPVTILEIKNPEGKVIYKFDGTGMKNRVLSKNAVEAIIPALQEVITRGTGGRAKTGRLAAGKTGTTSNYKDAWFVGFTPDVATAVWIGNDDNTPLCAVSSCKGASIPGGTIPAPIWRDFMKHVSATRGFGKFEFPVEEVATDTADFNATGATEMMGAEPGGDASETVQPDTETEEIPEGINIERIPNDNPDDTGLDETPPDENKAPPADRKAPQDSKDTPNLF